MSAQNHLSPDLIEAILSLLPPKSLGRFKSVSKTWYSLISSPSFIKTHILNFIKNNPNPNPTHLILAPKSGDILVPAIGEYLYSLDIKQLNTQISPATVTAKCLNFQKEWVKILGSCNGLVLAKDKHHNIYLVNPTTHKSLKVPDSGGEIYDATHNGFGYDSSKDDYKVIYISYKADSDSDVDSTLVHVYSLRNNSWNKLPKHNIFGPGVLLNNNLHWLVENKHSKFAIAAFSLADEEFHEIELPDSINNDRVINYFQVYAFDGKLFVLVYYWLFHEKFRYKLWVMEEYGVPKSWTNLCTINTDVSVLNHFFAQVRNRDILLGNHWMNRIVIYNMDKKRCTSVKVEGCPRVSTKVYGTYVESLESLERFRYNNTR